MEEEKEGFLEAFVVFPDSKSSLTCSPKPVLHMGPHLWQRITHENLQEHLHSSLSSIFA